MPWSSGSWESSKDYRGSQVRPIPSLVHPQINPLCNRRSLVRERRGSLTTPRGRKHLICIVTIFKPRPQLQRCINKLLKPTMTGCAEKRKASTTHQSSSPPKKRTFSLKTPSPMKPASPKTASMSRSERKKSKKRTSITEEQHTPPQRTSTSSPPNTPKSPSGPLKLGLNKGTAKSLLKHGSKITPLYKMLYEFAQIVMEKQPRSEQQFKPIVDQLAGQLVNLLSSELPLSFFHSFPFPLPFQPLTLRIPNCWKEKHFPQYLLVNMMPCLKQSI